METAVTYFTESGKVNTQETLRLAKRRADALGIRSIIVASTTGETGMRVAEQFKGYRVIVVSHVWGSRGANTSTMSDESRARVRALGGEVVHAAHVFGGIGRAIHNKFNTIQVDEIIANVLRVFCQGLKVIPEIAMMAADAGLVRTDEEVVVIAGTGRGADTAAVVKPANSRNFFDLRVLEIICKPRQ